MAGTTDNTQRHCDTKKAARLLWALELIMKKCCNKTLIPKIRYRASIMDSIGLTILLSFFLSIATLIALGLSSLLVFQVTDGSFGERQWYGRTGTGIAALLFGLYWFLPKFINACSYLVNYKLKVVSTCKHCNTEHLLADYPKNHDPF